MSSLHAKISYGEEVLKGLSMLLESRSTVGPLDRIWNVQDTCLFGMKNNKHLTLWIDNIPIKMNSFVKKV